MASLGFAFLVGLAFTVWLARSQSRGEPRFQTQPRRRWSSAGRWLLLAGAALGAGAFGLYLQRGALRWAAPAPPPPAETALAPAATATSRPIQLRASMLIPALGMEEKIMPIPLVRGEWDIAGLSHEVGWLESTGAHPGADLAMAFIGHVTLSALDRGPFADLWTLQPSAQVIYRWGGTDYIYAVEDTYPLKPEQSDRLFVRDGARLLLVTCTNWNYLAETYSARLVAEAVLVEQRPSP